MGGHVGTIWEEWGKEKIMIRISCIKLSSIKRKRRKHLFRFIYFMCMSPLPASQAWGAHRGQKTLSDIMEVESRMVVSCNVSAGNRTWDLWKISQGFQQLNCASSPTHSWWEQHSSFYLIVGNWNSQKTCRKDRRLECHDCGELERCSSRIKLSWAIFGGFNRHPLPNSVPSLTTLWLSG